MRNRETNKRVFVGMSGGVDSSVAAALLKERGFDVTGVHIKMWSDPEIPCNFKRDREDAMRVAARLGIPFETWDFTAEYRKAVVEYLIREYAAGRTPNPDVMCNRRIKFGIFLRAARARGADYIATGHYARITFRGGRLLAGGRTEERYALYAAKDVNKDQSYFLWTLAQDHMRHILFPVGEYTKPEVRALAKTYDLPTAEKKESQGICFIGEIDLREFLKRYIPVSRGAIVTASGKAIGEHEGLSFYTIGQREGLRIGGGIPYYVAAKDFSQNVLVVAEGPYDDALFRRETGARDVHWISGRQPPFPFSCEARIRYRQPLQRVILRSTRHLFAVDDRTKSALRISFESPQRAVTPGQSVVFYRGEEVLGGGVIAEAE